MAYAIICDARSGEDLGIDTLALVDRRKTRSIWWTSDNVGLILKYVKRTAAEYACSRLRMNNARVVAFDYAKEVIRDHERCIAEDEIMASAEMGWDAHKSV